MFKVYKQLHYLNKNYNNNKKFFRLYFDLPILDLKTSNKEKKILTISRTANNIFLFIKFVKISIKFSYL